MARDVIQQVRRAASAGLRRQARLVDRLRETRVIPSMRSTSFDEAELVFVRVALNSMDVVQRILEGAEMDELRAAAAEVIDV